MAAVIEAKHLHKGYGSTVAVEEVSFEVEAGEIFGLLGPNGAGKTTTIECLEGLRKPDGGQVRILGLDPLQDAPALRLCTGIQLQQSNLPDRMRVWEALDLYASFYPKAVEWNGLLDSLGLAEKRDAFFSKLSGGQKQRLFIALALLPDPQLVFLDELTTGLDPQARHAIWDLVLDVRGRGKTVFMTTHFMEEAERLCDRVAILDHGRIVALDTPAALIQSLGGEQRVLFRVEHGLTAALQERLACAGRLEIHGDQVILHGKDGPDTPLVSQVVGLLAAQGMPVRDLRTEQPNLEDVFLKLTGREMRN